MKKTLLKICDCLLGKQISKSMPRAWVFLNDILILLLSYVLALVLSHFGTENALFKGTRFLTGFIGPLVAYSAMFLAFRTSHDMLRCSLFKDMFRVLEACTLAFVILLISRYISSHYSIDVLIITLPEITETIDLYLIDLLVMILCRLYIHRVYKEFYKNHKMNTLVYGVDNNAVMLCKSLSNDRNSPYAIFAFIDDEKNKTVKECNGIPVYHCDKALDENFVSQNDIQAMIVAKPSLDMERRQRIFEKGIDLKLKVEIINNYGAWNAAKDSLNQIRDINIEDLLGREPAKIDNASVRNSIDGKVVMITGAAGSIGSEICRQVLHYNPKRIVMVDQAETPLFELQLELTHSTEFKTVIDKMIFIVANVKDLRRMEEVFEENHPQIIYHAAAYKHVPLMEENPYEAVCVNVFGTKNIADLAVKHKVEKFVMLSTDKAVNPASVMGVTKRIAEIYTQSRNSATKFITTRFGNVMGSTGSVVPLFSKQLEQGGPLTVTDKNVMRYFMTIPEACSLVLEAGSIGDDDDIFVFDMGKQIKIWDLAEKMRKLANKPNVEIKEVGLRPGEKLYEEIIVGKEDTVPTNNPKILKTKVREYKPEVVDALLESLAKELQTCDAFRIVAQMKCIVPEYISNNSVFEKLDEKA